MEHVSTQQVSAGDVVGLRSRILRAGLPRESAIFDGDELSTTLHFGAHVDGEMVTCLTLLLGKYEAEPAWQLRGMATDERWRNSGMGRALVEYAIALARVRRPDIRLFWCNARITAAGFYEKVDWRVVSPPFEVPTVGHHVKMMFRAGA